MDSDKTTCKIKICDAHSYLKGFCKEHLEVLLNYNDCDEESLRARGRWNKSPDNVCPVKDCQSKRFSLGFCTKHYQRFLKSGDPLMIKGWVPSESTSTRTVCKPAATEDGDSLILRIEIFKPSKDISLRVIVEDHQQTQEIQVLGSE